MVPYLLLLGSEVWALASDGFLGGGGGVCRVPH